MGGQKYFSQGRKDAEKKLISFCRVGTAHHRSVPIKSSLSGNARPTLETKNYFYFFLRPCENLF